MIWNDKPYHSLDYELKQRFGEKVYRLSLNGGMSCPNRDGKLGHRGCIFCSEGGSGDFAGQAGLPIPLQIAQQKALLRSKRPVNKYIAYFQAYTNTYGPVTYLRSIFTEAIMQPEIVALSVATRPDCLEDDVIELLTELNRIKPVWVELGLQTIHENSAAWMRRGYSLPCFENAVSRLHEHGLEVIVHTILGLPVETPEQMLQTVRYLNHVPIQGIKLQLLHVLRNTELGDQYEKEPFHVFTMEEYLNLLIRCLEELSPDLVIHRLTGDGPKDLLLAPEWSRSKRTVLNTLHQKMRELDSWQGKYFCADTARKEPHL